MKKILIVLSFLALAGCNEVTVVCGQDGHLYKRVSPDNGNQYNASAEVIRSDKQVCSVNQDGSFTVRQQQ